MAFPIANGRYPIAHDPEQEPIDNPRSGTALIGSDLVANILLDFQLKTRGCRGKNLGFISLRLTKAGVVELADAQR